MGGHQGFSGAVGRESHTPRWLNRQSPDGRTISDTHAPAHPGIPIRERNDKIGKILVDIGSIVQRDVLAAFSDQLGIPLVRVAGPPPASPEIEGLTERVLRQSRALPMALVDSTLKL